eukprot:CAMPEP_0202448662 /NCGR_PEP_ID=MMETSP1360-20130828/7468_1 /ASSEMBLY_ACC=CAM_ASM_000848 /TAXON_ID=515479 /ORGANISM="Licmophora paradoxa, Strain CCMP2313" /LENGTH=50 /DNA_ID=CAMNT_0049066339 /DNA_START=17 /DNA_END=169 /DNA_ORIENTATION=+
MSSKPHEPTVQVPDVGKAVAVEEVVAQQPELVAEDNQDVQVEVALDVDAE